MKFINYILTFSLLIIPPIFIIKYTKRKEKQALDTLSKTYNNINTLYKCFFFTHKNLNCNPHIAKKIICGVNCSQLRLQNIISLFDGAKTSIFVCMYHLSITRLHWALSKAKERGVDVRVITDSTMMQIESSKIKSLKDLGVQVKVQNNPANIMHHKFVIIDKSDKNEETGKLLFGSLNYTINAFVRNWEFTCLTDDEAIVRRFSQEFQSLWDDTNFKMLE